jgi:acyl-CoA hydrolase
MTDPRVTEEVGDVLFLALPQAGLSRADTGVIVTEYGVADLRGLSLARRRERMIAIAHPDHREALEAAAGDGTEDQR